MFEHRKKPIVSKEKYYSRLFKNFLYSLIIMSFSIALGTFGYHYWGQLNLVDSFYNTCMILTGMGPVNIIQTTSGKLFASFYALYSGVAFLTTIAVLIAPVVHRFMHSFHLETED